MKQINTYQEQIYPHNLQKILQQFTQQDEDERDAYFLSTIYTVDQFENIADEFLSDLPTVTKMQGKTQIEYYNVANAFDIETTSIYKSTLSIMKKDRNDKSKTAFMYIWQVMINGCIIIGRTWKEFGKLIDLLNEKLNLHKFSRFVFYVHNLSYEFQFMRKYFEIEDLFAVDSRTPVRFRIGGVEFRDSYILSGYALSNLYRDLVHPIHKKDGDLNYKLIRHKDTVLTGKELLYCIYDVFVVSVFIYEKIEAGESIARIPFTKTGYVRNECRQQTLINNDKKWDYKKLINDLTLDPFEYIKLKKTYQGGFTHANALYVDDVLENVASYDFTSSYPTVLISEKYPMSKVRWANPDESQRHNEGAIKLLKHLKNCDYAYMCQVAFINIRAKIEQECYISESHCEVLKDKCVDNGRVYSARVLVTNMTDIDFEIIEEVYEWDEIEIAEIGVYKYEYLPTELVKTILDFYVKKTTLKDVEDKIIEYGLKKGMLNGIYGMMCQDPLQPINEYDGEWRSEPVDINDGIDKYNKDKKRFTFYPWGVWCCAHARKNLFSAILELGEDYIYSDTDSVKFINPEKHKEYFDNYNREIIKKLEDAMEYHGLDKSLIRPKTIKGVEKPLGVWDNETANGLYEKIKVLGAKRYLVQDHGKLKQTIAGLSKKEGLKYIEKQEDPWNFFKAGDKDNAMFIPAEYTGKQTLTYIDYEDEGKVVDYMGLTSTYECKSCIHMEGASFSMSLSDEFIKFLEGYKEKTL